MYRTSTPPLREGLVVREVHAHAQASNLGRTVRRRKTLFCVWRSKCRIVVSAYKAATTEMISMDRCTEAKRTQQLRKGEVSRQEGKSVYSESAYGSNSGITR